MFAAYDWKIPVGDWVKLPHAERTTMVATVVARNLIDARVMKDAESSRGKP